MSGQERQSLEAVSRSESTELPFNEMESEDIQYLVVLGLPTTVSSSGSVGPLMGLEEGWGISHCGCPESVLVSGVGLGVWSLPCVEVCSLPTSTSGKVTQVLLM